MANKVPVKAVFNAAGTDVIALGEYTPTDTIASTYLSTGTGATDVAAGDHTHSVASSSALGLIKIEDDTDQAVAANAVSATAGRTYGVQLTSGNQAVVNIPWTDTDTNTDTKWNGGATGLVPGDGRTSLGLGTAATSAATDFVAVSGDTMTGALVLGGNLTVGSNAVSLNDNSHIKIGTGSDLRIYHDAFNSYIDNSTGTGEIILKKGTNKLSTTATGVDVSGLSVTGPITEQETVKTASFTPNLTADGTIYDCSGAMLITMPSATAGKAFTIIHSGSGTVTWSGVKWPSATIPTLSGITVLSFISNGTDWYGMQAGTGFA